MVVVVVYFTSILIYILTFYMIFQVRLTDWGLEDTNKTVICLVKNLPKQHSQLDIEIMVCQQSLC